MFVQHAHWRTTKGKTWGWVCDLATCGFPVDETTALCTVCGRRQPPGSCKVFASYPGTQRRTTGNRRRAGASDSPYQSYYGMYGFDELADDAEAFPPDSALRQRALLDPTNFHAYD